MSKITHNITLAELLAQNKFYEAIEFYIDSPSHKKSTHDKMIKTYLSTLVKEDVKKALTFMRAYLDEVPESKISALMIDTYIGQGDYSKAIDIIIEVKEYYGDIEDEIKFSRKLKNTAKEYISVLTKGEDYGELVDFLESMIALDDRDSFYSFTLAELYMDLEKTGEAALLLESLEYDETYGEKATKHMKNIKEEESEKEYEYSIPLKRYGAHFSVLVTLDGTTLNLMLDTGATFIFIDEDKASMLEVVHNNLSLRTAGNTIQATLCKASLLQMGNLQLENMEVTVAPFKRNGIDGLLGMNFFKRFNFFIDQDESVLYLDTK
jgi:clan AA aspartic protease (TIGR02281 family)